MSQRARQPPGAANAAADSRLEPKILAGVCQRYADFGPALAAEHLAQGGFGVSRETLLKRMNKAALRRPCRRSLKTVHVWSERRASFEELVMRRAVSQ